MRRDFGNYGDKISEATDFGNFMNIVWGNLCK